MVDSNITIALAGNPNSGKTTMFNALTGANQHVGNWPGVTVEKKDGRLKGHSDVVIQDLPGIYSLSPYTPEEVITRNYLIEDKPAAIVNIVDASNLERNLYLTTQLTELGIPVVLALNMMDVVHKRGDRIDTNALSEALGVTVVEASAVRGEGCVEAVENALALARGMVKGGHNHQSLGHQHHSEHHHQHQHPDKQHPDKQHPQQQHHQSNGHHKHDFFAPRHHFAEDVEQTLHQITQLIESYVTKTNRRWYAIKAFERDMVAMQALTLNAEAATKLEAAISALEEARDDDSESIIANERYAFISRVITNIISYKNAGAATMSDKIDRVVTNRVAALPIFAAVMFLVYFLAIMTVGTSVTDWVNEGIFGDGFLPTVLADFLQSVEAAPWLQSLLIDGILAGVGAVLGFLPQMLVLFLLLALLEECGYMARIAFIMDRVFKRFGLSGKSFIPILIGTGCGVPGILASRTIENESNRRLTVMTTTFIPCSAKLPIIALITGALFAGSALQMWIGPLTYFIGIAAIICSGIILKKTRLFIGDPSPFLIELPAYHLPRPKSVLRVMLERAWAFVKRAGSIILLATVLVWFLSSFDFSLNMVDTGESILAAVGSTIAWVFSPLGWGDWQATVAAITGLIAKENVVGTFGVLYGFAEVAEDGLEVWGTLAASFTAISAFSFLLFNLLCAPCFAAIGAIHREMASPKWTLIAVGYQCVFAYVVAFCFFQIATLVTGGSFTFATGLAFVLVVGFLFLLFRPNPAKRAQRRSDSSTTANSQPTA